MKNNELKIDQHTDNFLIEKFKFMYKAINVLFTNNIIERLL